MELDDLDYPVRYLKVVVQLVTVPLLSNCYQATPVPNLYQISKIEVMTQINVDMTSKFKGVDEQQFGKLG